MLIFPCNTGFEKLGETNWKGSTAQTVNAIETFLTSIDGRDIQEYESRRILKIYAVVFEQFQPPLKSARGLFSSENCYKIGTRRDIYICLIGLILRRIFCWTKSGQLRLCSVSGSNFIPISKNGILQKKEMFVYENWNQILYNMKIALAAWKFCHIVFGTSLTTYKTNKIKKLNTEIPK